MKSTDERPSGGELYYYSMYHLKKCMVMIATWPFSSSKCSPDISQLNVTIPRPVSGCPLEREPRWVGDSFTLGHQGVGVRGRISALPAEVFHSGSTSSCSTPVLSTAGWWGRLHRPRDLAAILLLPSCVWCDPPNVISSKMHLFSHIWTSLKSICVLPLMLDDGSVGSVVLLTSASNNR